VKRIVLLTAQLAILAACVYYAVSAFDLGRVVGALVAIPAWKIALVLLFQALLAVPLSLLRLLTLCRFEAPWLTALVAQSLGQFLNLVLPAKLGEAAKMALLSRAMPGGFSRITEIVFWERFSDLNALLALVLASGALVGGLGLALPVAVVVGGFWGAIVVLKLWGDHLDRLLALLPWPRLGGFLAGVARAIRVRLTPGFAAGLALLTLPLWLGQVLIHGLVLCWGLGLQLTPLEVLAVATAGMAGLVTPATPGSLGVYEAAVVAMLTAFGQPREEALAGALLLHAIAVAPVLLIGAWATARVGFKAAIGLGREKME
jgi:uncharacterized membrane protein YbhN (UPF0104 family)